MAIKNRGAVRGQALRCCVLRSVGTLDALTEVQENLGNARHAGPADAHKVNGLDLVPHAIASGGMEDRDDIRSTTAAARRAASCIRRCRARWAQCISDCRVLPRRMSAMRAAI